MKALVLTHTEWAKVKQQLINDYGFSISISWVSRRKLGFTAREHTDYTDGRYHSAMHIDFYSEEARTFFLLRYMNRD